MDGRGVLQLFNPHAWNRFVESHLFLSPFHSLCLRHVLIELLSHALKYTTAGEVKLSAMLAGAQAVHSDKVVLR